MGLSWFVRPFLDTMGWVRGVSLPPPLSGLPFCILGIAATMQSVGLRIGSSDLIGLDWIWIWPPIQSSQSKLCWSSWISNSHPVKKSANRTISNLGMSSSFDIEFIYSTGYSLNSSGCTIVFGSWEVVSVDAGARIIKRSESTLLYTVRVVLEETGN